MADPIIAVGGMVNKKQHLSLCGGRVLECHVIGFVSRGRGFYEDRRRGRVPVEAPAAICQFPGVWHCFDPAPDETWDEDWVMFDGGAVGSLLEPVLPRDAVIPCPDNASLILDAFRQLHAAWFFEDRLQRARIPFHFHRILHELHVARFGRMLPDNPVERLRQEMARRLDLPDFDTDAFSRTCSISWERLRKDFRRETGAAPKQYFLQLKLSRAKELLLLPGIRIGDAARRVGFEDAYYFSRLFRSKTGLSPRAWRRMHLGTRDDDAD